MARNFRELEAQMPPESLAQAKAQAREIMADMLLSEARKLVGLTQEQLADELQNKRKIESRVAEQGRPKGKLL